MYVWFILGAVFGDLSTYTYTGVCLHFGWSSLFRQAGDEFNSHTRLIFRTPKHLLLTIHIYFLREFSSCAFLHMISKNMIKSMCIFTHILNWIKIDTYYKDRHIRDLFANATITLLKTFLIVIEWIAKNPFYKNISILFFS